MMNEFFEDDLSSVDPIVAKAIDDEIARQSGGLELIASENFVSEAVLQAAGSVFTNKYAEGYPGKRYYGGCEFSDVVEQLAYDFLSDTHGGWENNDGAYGEFCFDAAARCIHLEFNERFTSSELYTHDF